MQRSTATLVKKLEFQGIWITWNGEVTLVVENQQGWWTIEQAAAQAEEALAQRYRETGYPGAVLALPKQMHLRLAGVDHAKEVYEWTEQQLYQKMSAMEAFRSRPTVLFQGENLMALPKPRVSNGVSPETIAKDPLRYSLASASCYSDVLQKAVKSA